MKDIPAETPAELESKHLWRIKQLDQNVSAILTVLETLLIRSGMSRDQAQAEIQKAQQIHKPI